MEQTLFKEILKSRVYEVATRTPLEKAHSLSDVYHNQIFMKREDLQPIFSFKIRGAYNKIASLSQEELKHGVICASAGNHGQGVALSARRLGVQAWVVMPKTTPEIKIKAVARYGAEVVLRGDHYTEAYEHCLKVTKETGATMIHPFDDLHVIAGQGTVGKEIVEDCPRVDEVYVPVGGGGLLAGVAGYIRALYPDVKIFGVEPCDSDAMARSVSAGKPVVLQEVGIFADGVAVKKVGDLTLRYCRDLCDGFIRVSTDEICSAIQDIYQTTRTLVEPAGALAWAGAKARIAAQQLKDRNIVVINSGANMSFQRLQFVAERAMMGAGRECLFAVSLPERPGALRAFCTNALQGESITEFNYRTKCAKTADILVGVSLSLAETHTGFAQRLEALGYHFEDLTTNDLAKEHVRHMVGGRPPQPLVEELYSFIFPEKPGALTNFLAPLSERWNISLFHYRSHGADYGRVLIAFEVGELDRSLFEAELAKVGYPFIRETHNPAYKLLLSGDIN